MKFVNVRIKLAKQLFKVVAWIAPPPEQTEEYKSLPDELRLSQDAVAEVDGVPDQWQPEQHGNSIIAEPELMNRYRRGKL